MEQYDKKKMKE